MSLVLLSRWTPYTVRHPFRVATLQQASTRRDDGSTAALPPWRQHETRATNSSNPIDARLLQVYHWATAPGGCSSWGNTTAAANIVPFLSFYLGASTPGACVKNTSFSASRASTCDTTEIRGTVLQTSSELMENGWKQTRRQARCHPSLWCLVPGSAHKSKYCSEKK